ncbi:MAG: plastocyanin/azurin family copper-binding protein [Candidatus Nitrosopelagicus sp.]|nr:plastocyanin/azurin family copper-binding protein [Candidatus Nitrosopelagicus sp.]
MTSADKFGIAFAIGITAVMIGLISGGTFETSQPSPIQSAPTQTYSPPPQAAVEESAPAQAPIMTPSDDDLTDVLSYNIRGAVVDSIVGDSDNNSVNVLIDARLDGNLTITISSSVVEPFADGTYFVLVDGEEIHDFTQTGSILSIPFLAGATEVTILGITDDYVAAQAADKAAADKAAAEHEAMMAEKAAAEKAAAEKAAAEKAAALPMSISIENAIGSSTPGCEPDCFIPNAATVAVGGTVSFVNSDTAPHTSTSGTPADGPDGVWDSSLVMPGSSYDTTISSAGTYDYFCMVHPWMTGTITAK